MPDEYNCMVKQVTHFATVQRNRAAKGYLSDYFELKSRDGALFFSCSMSNLLGVEAALCSMVPNQQAKYDLRFNRKAFKLIEAVLKLKYTMLVNKIIPEYERRILAGNLDLKGYLVECEKSLTLIAELLKKIRKEIM